MTSGSGIQGGGAQNLPPDSSVWSSPSPPKHEKGGKGGHVTAAGGGGKATSTGTPATTSQVKISTKARETDTIENEPTDTQISNSDNSKQQEIIRKAYGFAHATFSPTELDQMQPGHPALLGHKGEVQSSPPKGSQGTGNPFFNPNPMVAFFTAFFSMLQVMKEIAMLSAKLNSMETRVIKETGKAQAQAALEQGKAAYNSDMKQAYMSIGQAGLAGANAVMQVGLFAHSAMSVTSQADEMSQAKNKTETALSNKEDEVSVEGAKLQGQINAFKRANTNPAEGKGELTEDEITQNDEDLNKMVMKRDKLKEEQAVREEQTTQNQKKLQKSNLDESDEKETFEISDAQKKKTGRQEKEDAAIKAGEDDFNAKLEEGKNSGKTHQEALDTIKKDMNKGQKKVDALNEEAKSLNKDVERQTHEINTFKAARSRHVGEQLHMHPVGQIWSATLGPQGPMNSVLEAAKSIVKAQGDLQTAMWRAKEQQYSTDLQIAFKQADLVASLGQDAYQMAGDLCSSLQKMSDQMPARWSV